MPPDAVQKYHLLRLLVRGTGRTTLAIHTVNGEFVRRFQLDKAISLEGITVTVEGHIAVAFVDKDYNAKVTLILL